MKIFENVFIIAMTICPCLMVTVSGCFVVQNYTGLPPIYKDIAGIDYQVNELYSDVDSLNRQINEWREKCYKK